MKKTLKWLGIGFVALLILGALLGDDEQGSSQNDDRAAALKSTATSTPEPAPEPTPEPTPEPVSLSFDGPGSTKSDQVTLKGHVSPPGAKVKVSGKSASVKGGKWKVVVPIRAMGQNRYKVVATKNGHEGDTTTATVTRKQSAAEKAAAIAAERQAFINAATTIPYNQLQKNPRRYKGTKVVYRGQIFQIQEDFGSTWMLLSVTDEGYGFWDDNVWVEYPGTIKGAEEDIITIYGTVRGGKSYDTQIGGSTYVPRIDAKYVIE